MVVDKMSIITFVKTIPIILHLMEVLFVYTNFMAKMIS